MYFNLFIPPLQSQKSYEVSLFAAGLVCWLVRGVECPEIPFELVDITQDPWKESRHPSARAVRGQAGSLRVSHMAPDVFG